MTKSMIIITSSIVFIEWVEFSLYMYLGIKISSIFFSADLGHYKLILTYAIFSISYLSRPVGGYLFGLYSDKKGRRHPLITSSFLMGLSTITIGLIPSYQQIGITAPILLLIFRLIQSLSISGEFNNSSIFLMEHNPVQQTFAGSWAGMASSAGMFVGGLIAFIIGLTNNLWSWRVAYIAIGTTSLLLMLLRYKLQESPLFININKADLPDFSLKKMFFNYKKGLLKIACISTFMSVYIYTCNIYFVSYLVQKAHFSLGKASLYMTIVQAFVTILIPLISYLNKVSLKKILQICIILMCITAPVLFYSAPYQSEKMLITGLILYVISNSGISAVVFAYMYNCLPTKYRCTGTGLTWNLCSTIFGSTSPIIASIFVSQGYIEIPVLYIALIGLITIVSLNIKQAIKIIPSKIKI